MPYVNRPKRPRGRIAALVTMSAVALLGAPAAAQAACPATPTTKAFSQFGDYADYSLLANGGFETGTAGWLLSGASVVAGNETYKVRAATDKYSLAIAPSGRVTSPAFCVGIAQPTFRFFARRTSGTWGVLYVYLRWSSAGGSGQTLIGSVSGATSAWAPTRAFSLAQAVGVWSPTQTANVQIVLDPDHTGGGWAVDDVYIDPFTRR